MMLEVDVRQERGAKGSWRVVAQPALLAPERLPRIARLLALAHKWDALVRQGVIANYAALARLGHVSRARITQIMNLLCLNPNTQEAILFLPPTQRGRDPIQLRHLQPIARVADWGRQRTLWRKLLADQYPILLTESPAGSKPTEVIDLAVSGSAPVPPPAARPKNAPSTLPTTGKEHHDQV
jgi:hypothetical protein